MSWRRFKESYFGVDGALITAGLAALVASLYFFFQDDNLGRKNTEMKPVGQVIASKKDVRRRIESGFTWSSISPADEVYEGDSIFTGEDSETSIDLDNGNRLKIDPRSLIVIRTQGDRLQLDLAYGSLSGQVKADAPISITQNGQTQEISGQDAEIRVESANKGEETKIRIVKGEVRIKSSSKKESTPPKVSVARENEVVELKPKEEPVVRKLEIELLAPENSRPLWLTSGRKLAFRWRFANGAKPISTRLEIAEDPEFKSLLTSQETSGTHVDIATDHLRTGPAYWRVRPTDPGASANMVDNGSRFFVYPDTAPIPIAPAPEQDFTYRAHEGEAGKAIELGWQDKGGSTSFDVEIAKDPEFKSIVASGSSQIAKHVSPSLTVGDYHWRVRGTHEARANPPWSQASRFKIDTEAFQPNSPKLAETLIKYEIPTSVLERAPANATGLGVAPEGLKPFAWSDVNGTESFEVEVSSTEKFTKSTKLSVGAEKSFAPQEVKPGTSFVRVRALGRKGFVSPPSDIGRLEVSLPPPILKPLKTEEITAKSKAEFDQAKHSFDLTWTPRPYAESYELEWGSDKEFKQSKTFRSATPEQKVTVSESSEYNARVRALGPGGIPISAFSPVESAAFKKSLLLPPPPTPTPVATKPTPSKAPASVDTKALRLKEMRTPKLQEPMSDSSFVALEGSIPFVNFRWKPISGASEYELQISSDAAFANVLDTVTIKNTRYTLKKQPPEGRVYWRVRSIFPDGPSNWSTANEINVTYQ